MQHEQPDRQTPAAQTPPCTARNNGRIGAPCRLQRKQHVAAASSYQGSIMVILIISTIGIAISPVIIPSLLSSSSLLSSPSSLLSWCPYHRCCLIIAFSALVIRETTAAVALRAGLTQGRPWRQLIRCCFLAAQRGALSWPPSLAGAGGRRGASRPRSASSCSCRSSLSLSLPECVSYSVSRHSSPFPPSFFH